MLIRISHRTGYAHEFASTYAIQHMLVEPVSAAFQNIVEWRVDAPGYATSARYLDGFGNMAHLVNQTQPTHDFAVVIEGLVETKGTDGVVGRLSQDPIPSIFLRQTDLTRPSGPMSTLARRAGEAGSTIAKMHAMMGFIRESMRFDAGMTDSGTMASDALALGHGVCQDFTHVMIGAARDIGLPARYVTGYLLMDDAIRGEAHHAWAEIWDNDLGWIGFDAANGICPTELYVRLAAGLDASTAAPIRGIRRGAGRDELRVQVGVHQEAAQQ
jgi:transglutaminase-like putative cysteine protease